MTSAPPSPSTVGSFSQFCKKFENEKLGEGSYGKVYKGQNVKTGQLVAIKEMKVLGLQAEMLEEAKREFAMLQRLQHPNVVATYDFTFDPSKGTACIYMEYIAGGVLSDFWKGGRYPNGLPEPLMRKYTRDMLQGLEPAHSQGLVHRDIKPANMLVDPSGNVKLADFGLCKGVSDVTSGDARGTYLYMSPGALSCQYSIASDLWAVGCTVLEMATARYPYSNAKPFPQDCRQLVAGIISRQLRPENDLRCVKTSVTEDMVDFCTLCWKEDPSLTCAVLLQHPFLSTDAPLSTFQVEAAPAFDINGYKGVTHLSDFEQQHKKTKALRIQRLVLVLSLLLSVSLSILMITSLAMTWNDLPSIFTLQSCSHDSRCRKAMAVLFILWVCTMLIFVAGVRAAIGRFSKGAVNLFHGVVGLSIIAMLGLIVVLLIGTLSLSEWQSDTWHSTAQSERCEVQLQWHCSGWDVCCSPSCTGDAPASSPSPIVSPPLAEELCPSNCTAGNVFEDTCSAVIGGKFDECTKHVVALLALLVVVYAWTSFRFTRLSRAVTAMKKSDCLQLDRSLSSPLLVIPSSSPR